MNLRFNRAFLVILAMVGMAICLPVMAQQTVDPSGTCTVDSKESTIVGQAGTYYCKPGGLGSATGTWTKMSHGINTVAYTIRFNNAALIATAGLTKDISLVALPAGAVVLSARIKSSTAFTGTTTLTASIGDSSSVTAFTSTVDLKAAVADTTFVANTAPKITTEAADTILVHFIATVDNLTALTAGVLKVTITYSLPADGATLLALTRFPPSYSPDAEVIWPSYRSPVWVIHRI